MIYSSNKYKRLGFAPRLCNIFINIPAEWNAQLWVFLIIISGNQLKVMEKKEGKQKGGEKASQYPNYLTLECPSYSVSTKSLNTRSKSTMNFINWNPNIRQKYFIFIVLNFYQWLWVIQHTTGNKVTWSNKYNTKAVMSTNE